MPITVLIGRKYMRLLTRMMFAVCLLAPVVSQAGLGWSTCQTITAIADDLAYNGSVNVLLSPGISGCVSNGIAGAINFAVGQDGVTATNVDGLLATSLAAFTAGKRVTILYDNSTSNCYSAIVAVGGYDAQCP
jgi:hypothetical protein